MNWSIIHAVAARDIDYSTIHICAPVNDAYNKNTVYRRPYTRVVKFVHLIPSCAIFFPGIGTSARTFAILQRTSKEK